MKDKQNDESAWLTVDETIKLASDISRGLQIKRDSQLEIIQEIEEKIRKKSYRLSCINENLEGEVIDISELNKILKQMKMELII